MIYMKKATSIVLTAAFITGISVCYNVNSAFAYSGSTNTSISYQAEELGVTLPYSQEAQAKYDLPSEFSINYMPKMLIVMSNSPVEILHELGVEMLAVPNILDESQDWIQDLDAERLPLTASTLDVEAILSREPDMIIMSAGKREKYGKFFENNGTPVYYLVTTGNGTIEDVRYDVTVYGKAFHKEHETEKILAKFDQLEADIEAWKKENSSLAGQKMMILLDCPPGYTNNSQTALGDMLKRLGYENITDSIPGLESMMGSNTLYISTEIIVSQNPPIIIAQPAGTGMGISITSKAFETMLQTEFKKNSALWNSISAVKNGRILCLGTDDYPGTVGLGILDCYYYLMENLPTL